MFSVNNIMTEYSQNYIEQIYTNNVIRKYISPKNPYGRCIKCRRLYRGSVDTHLYFLQYCYPCSRKQAVLTIQRIFRSWNQKRINSAKIIQRAVIKWLYRPDGSFMKQAKDRYYQIMSGQTKEISK